MYTQSNKPLAVTTRAACCAHLRSARLARIYGAHPYDIRARSQALPRNGSVQFDDEEGTRSKHDRQRQ